MLITQLLKYNSCVFFLYFDNKFRLIKGDFMELRKFNANGQLLFVEPSWITGQSCLFTITDRQEYRKGLMGLSKIRKEFLKQLEEEGFVITTDKQDIKNDIIYLIMNDQSLFIDEVPINVYKRAFDKRIFASGGEKLCYPHSVSMEEYFDYPFFPAVFKNELMNGGIDKFLIETPEQLITLKKFYNKYKDNKYYADAFSGSIFQQLIETPTEYHTYMRVLMSASGDILGASLKYSSCNDYQREPRGIFEKHFWDKNSEFYLNCNGMFNYYSGGGNINFSQKHFNYEQEQILKAHGIDPEDLKVPDDVLEVAANIAYNCNKELGIMCGIDFIFNKEDNKWYYLEIQSFPAIDEWAIPRKKRIPNVRNINDYIKYNALDLEARYEALMLYMAKKQDLDNNHKLRLHKND